MPVLSNPKHELFAQELAKGKSATDAYVEAGYAPNQPNASRLISNDMVQARLAELQNRVAIRTEVTAASLIEEAEAVRVAAMAAGQFAPAVAAIKEKGVLAGVRVEKRENTNRSVNDMSDDELAAIIRAGGAGDSEASVSPSKLN